VVDDCDPLAGITQEKLDGHVGSRLADLRVARAFAEGARRVADAAEEAADDAERAIRGSEVSLIQFLDAARAKLPHLNVPTFEDATKDLEEYR